MPNNFEKRRVLNTYNYKYQKRLNCGDGKLFINNKSPDFINKEEKIIVLANGNYWHLTIYGLDQTIPNKKLREEIESEPFLKAGYKVIFIWEDEFYKNLKI